MRKVIREQITEELGDNVDVTVISEVSPLFADSFRGITEAKGCRKKQDT